MSSTFDLVSPPSNSPSSSKSSKKILYICLVLTFLMVMACAALIAVVFLGIHCPKESKASPTVNHHKQALDESVKFVVMTDFHIDEYYDDGVTAKPTLCRRLGNYANASYKAPVGRVGCDSPAALVDSAMSHAASNVRDASFVMLTGDLSAHDVSEPYFTNTTTPSQRTLNNILTLANKTKKSFPNIPIFPMFGNNDLPGHYILPGNDSWYSTTLDSFAPLILCEGCPGNGPKPTSMDDLKKTFLDGGYYSVVLPNTNNRIVLLALNTLYWNIKVAKKPQGPAFHEIARRQMTWMEEQLKQAKQKGQKVFLASHISPGIDPYNGATLWASNYTEMYVKIVAGKYRETVAGQIYAHIHKDDFHLQVLDTQTPTVAPDSQSPVNKSFVLLVGPVSPIYGNNPSYRVGYLDIDKQVLLDYDTFYLNLVMATESKSPTWQFGYRFSDRYPSSYPYIDAERIYQLTQGLVNTTSDQPWINYVFARLMFNNPGKYSRFSLYCSMRHVFDSDYQKCLLKYSVPGG